MRQIIKLCNEIAGEIKERRERMMMKRMWYELNSGTEKTCASCQLVPAGAYTALV